MGKLSEIIDGFKNLVWENPRIEKIAMDRAVICSDCIYNVQNTCSQCGCFLIAKTRSEYSKCPMNKWNK
jgi:hypothetical protein